MSDATDSNAVRQAPATHRAHCVARGSAQRGRCLTFTAVLAFALGMASCGDPLTVTAPYQTVTDSFVISALTGTPISAPSLWRIGEFRRYRLDSIGSQFDIGLDIDASGRIIVYPARSIAISPSGTSGGPPSVALLATTRTYSSADRAPEAGYTVDTAITVNRGQTVYVRSNSDFCLSQSTGGTLLYAKFIVDSVNRVTRELIVRSTIQPSCNFRSFASGVPTF